MIDIYIYTYIYIYICIYSYSQIWKRKLAYELIDINRDLLFHLRMTTYKPYDPSGDIPSTSGAITHLLGSSWARPPGKNVIVILAGYDALPCLFGHHAPHERPRTWGFPEMGVALPSGKTFTKCY